MKLFFMTAALAASLACATSVIDRAVTLAPTINHYTPTEGDSMRLAMMALTDTLVEGGYKVEIVPDEVMIQRNQGESAFGLHFRQFRLIALNGKYSTNVQFETLAHEAGHIFHGPVDNYAVAEVFAELVGSRVQRYYGSKTATRTSSDYLSRFKYAFPAVRYMQRDMDFAVKVLTNRAPWPELE